eukprot:195164_1
MITNHNIDILTELDEECGDNNNTLSLSKFEDHTVENDTQHLHAIKCTHRRKTPRKRSHSVSRNLNYQNCIDYHVELSNLFSLKICDIFLEILNFLNQYANQYA